MPTFPHPAGPSFHPPGVAGSATDRPGLFSDGLWTSRVGAASVRTSGADRFGSRAIDHDPRGPIFGLRCRTSADDPDPHNTWRGNGGVAINGTAPSITP